MLKFFVTYTVVAGVYHIELTHKGEWFGGGSTGCFHKDEAYYFACKVAASKGGRVERFGRFGR